MKMREMLFFLGFVFLSSPAFAGGMCAGDVLGGHWTNGYGDHFQIVGRTCDRVDVIDEGSHETFSLDLTGNTPMRLKMGGVKFDLRPTHGGWDRAGGFHEATLMWKIAPRSFELSPGLGVRIGVAAYARRDNERITKITPFIESFVSQPGDLGNLFDEGVNLVVKMLNHFKIADTLTRGCLEKNTLYRIK